MLGPMSYDEFKRTVETYQSIADKHSATLQTFPRGPMGLTPDAVKFSPEYQAAKRGYDNAASAPHKKSLRAADLEVAM